MHRSEVPDYKILLESANVVLLQKEGRPYFGVSTALNGDGNGKITSNPKKGVVAYIDELDKGDIITAINESPFPYGQRFDVFIEGSPLRIPKR